MPVYPVALLIQGTCQTSYYVGDYLDPTGSNINVSFSAGISGYSLHVAGVDEKYNVGAAVLCGFDQLGKGTTSYVSGFAFRMTGLWKMGSNSYTSNLGLHGKVGAYAKTIRDALLYRFPVRFAISYFPNLWLDEWFL